MLDTADILVGGQSFKTSKDGALVLQHLYERKIISLENLERANVAAMSVEYRVEHIMVQLGLLKKVDLEQAIVDVLNLDKLDDFEFNYEDIEYLGLEKDYLRRKQILPIEVGRETLHLGMADPLDEFTKTAISWKTKRDIVVSLIPSSLIEEKLPNIADADAAALNEACFPDDWEGGDTDQLRDNASEAPIIRYVNEMIERAVALGASDVHLRPKPGGARLRYRVDGRLIDMQPPIAQDLPAIISRCKILARLDIAERRLPQGGRIKFITDGRAIDLRVSTIPEIQGEGVVFRVLDREAAALDLNALGFSIGIQDRLEATLKNSTGIVLVTGPTGSGKTTTLYAGLKSIARPEINIMTVEDPVEYAIDGVSQVQVEEKTGLGFPEVLRTFLRQDPDVLMVGEIRDRETAEIAIQASLTGHLVLATLHTNSAASAIVRLRDMGLETYLIASTLRGVLAQRLVRKLCNKCSQPDHSGVVETYLAAWPNLLSKKPAPRRSAGCSACGGTGYSGRSAIGEMLIVDGHIRRAILNKESEDEIESRAIEAGMLAMFDDGLSHVCQGETTLTEVLAVLGETRRSK